MKRHGEEGTVKKEKKRQVSMRGRGSGERGRMGAFTIPTPLAMRFSPREREREQVFWAFLLLLKPTKKLRSTKDNKDGLES